MYTTISTRAEEELMFLCHKGEGCCQMPGIKNLHKLFRNVLELLVRTIRVLFHKKGTPVPVEVLMFLCQGGSIMEKSIWQAGDRFCNHRPICVWSMKSKKVDWQKHEKGKKLAELHLPPLTRPVCSACQRLLRQILCLRSQMSHLAHYW